MRRRSGASRNPERVVICTVVPAQAGIQSAWSYAPSFRRKPESRARGHMHRRSGASRNPERVAICTVIPAQAGIYLTQLDSGFRRSDGSTPRPPKLETLPAPPPPFPVRALGPAARPPKSKIPAKSGQIAPQSLLTNSRSGPYTSHRQVR